MKLTPEQQRVLLHAVRLAIRTALGVPVGAETPASDPSHPTPGDAPADPALLQPAGCFVSLHERTTHRLRGCVGRIEAVDPLLAAARAAAWNALEDPRFTHDPVRPAELPALEFELSILSPPRDAPRVTDFDPPADGIYLHCAGRCGCFLPQVARQTGWTREQLLARLCTEKMGLAATAWREPGARLQIFQALVLGPEPFHEA